jgi:hypothetical protein
LFEAKDDEVRRTFGRLCATIRNSMMLSDKGKSVSENDFYPVRAAEEQSQEVEDQIGFLSRLLGCGPNKPGTVH